MCLAILVHLLYHFQQYVFAFLFDLTRGKAHEDWLMKQKFGPLEPKIIVLDANQDLSQMRNHYEEYQDQIRGLKADCLDLCVKPVNVTPNR